MSCQLKILDETADLESLGVVFLCTGLDSVTDGIAVDWIQKIIFFTDTGTDEIVRMDYNGGNISQVINSGDEPRAIALDFAEKCVFSFSAYFNLSILRLLHKIPSYKVMSCANVSFFP